MRLIEMLYRVYCCKLSQLKLNYCTFYYFLTIYNYFLISTILGLKDVPSPIQWISKTFTSGYKIINILYICVYIMCIMYMNVFLYYMFIYDQSVFRYMAMYIYIIQLLVLIDIEFSFEFIKVKLLRQCCFRIFLILWNKRIHIYIYQYKCTPIFIQFKVAISAQTLCSMQPKTTNKYMTL